MQLPPKKPNHKGLVITGSDSEPLEQKKRPAWMDGIKEAMHRLLSKRGMGLEFRGNKWARCYMCFRASPIQNLTIEHVRPWNDIKNALDTAAAAKSDVKRVKFPEGTFLETDKGKLVPTKYAGVYYSNDLDNLVFMCGPCNSSKGKRDIGTALRTNVYSEMGDIAHDMNRLKYKELLDEMQEDEDPVGTYLSGMKNLPELGRLINDLNIAWQLDMERHASATAEAASRWQATMPLNTHREWADPTRTKTKAEASDNQESAMRNANANLDPKSLQRPFRDEPGDRILAQRLGPSMTSLAGDIAYGTRMSPEMHAKLSQLPLNKRPRLQSPQIAATLKQIDDDEALRKAKKIAEQKAAAAALEAQQEIARLRAKGGAAADNTKKRKASDNPPDSVITTQRVKNQASLHRIMGSDTTT